ncbi:MAG: VWA domain-containing protein [Phycisphaeraceae bacterium]|nr:VWA domain-containing protein [Phycisphaeraceae bacterium]
MSIGFSHPWVMLLLIVPAALAAWELTRRGVRVPVPVDHREHRPRRWAERLLASASVLPAVVLALVVVLLAGPQRMSPPAQERVLTNIEIVLDVSGSMSWPIGGQEGVTRFTAAMGAISEFRKMRKDDAYGLTAFGGEVIRWVPLTRDLTAIENAPKFLDPASNPHHLMSTRIAHALKFTMGTLAKQSEGDKLIVLISDGESPDLNGGAAQQIGNQLREDGIVLYAVHVGSDEVPGQLYEVVTPTGGQVFSANNPRSLVGIFEHIDRMVPVRIRATQPEPIDFFFPFAAACAAALALHGLCLFGLRYTPW